MNEIVTHSSDIDMYLIIGDEKHSVHAVGGDKLTMRDPVDIPISPVELFIVVDGRVTRRKGTLRYAMSSKRKEVFVDYEIGA